MKKWGIEVITFLIKLAIIIFVVFGFIKADDSVKWALVYLAMMVWDKVSDRKLEEEVNLLKERIDELECDLDNTNTRIFELEEKTNE